ncbi:unnamed protein product [Leptidea sinapis]|uniref:Uncharacterized protein n=1 Tax=Leptidea sinapis TaxID=189913 RepID=A0A5E4QAV8_9NEOP|nr:unnamed protein product [Leptidea sinapis]
MELPDDVMELHPSVFGTLRQEKRWTIMRCSKVSSCPEDRGSINKGKNSSVCWTHRKSIVAIIVRLVSVASIVVFVLFCSDMNMKGQPKDDLDMYYVKVKAKILVFVGHIENL